LSLWQLFHQQRFHFPFASSFENLYQEWGKKQTYIIAFCQDNIGLTPPIEDVTQMYTTDNKATIAKRRQEPEPFVAAAINSQIERIRRQEKL